MGPSIPKRSDRQTPLWITRFISKIKANVKRIEQLCVDHLTAMGNHMPYGITQC